MLEIYTDASYKDGMACMVFLVLKDSSEFVHLGVRVCTDCTSHLDAELKGIERGLQWVRAHYPPEEKFTVYSDSKSVFQRVHDVDIRYIKGHQEDFTPLSACDVLSRRLLKICLTQL